MDHEPMRQILRSLRSLTDSEDGVPEPDANLLERFVARRDAAAFELLLWRHGPMVLGVCRRLLPNSQDAADAFQATFLTLVKKAGSVAKRSALASWLYQVAYRVALRARITLARRSRCERPGVEDLSAPADGEPIDADLRRVLDEEVSRLPRRHREAFILCCLEGKTGAEAARLLGCPPGTISSRLTRARESLRRRLLRRGVAPAAGAAVAVLEGDAGAATTPVPLIHATLHAALSFAAGEAAGAALSPEAVSLAKGALRTMFHSQLKMAAVWLLVACVFAGGAVWSLQALAAGPAAQEQGEKIPERGGEPQKGLPVVQVMKPLPGGVEGKTSQECSVYAADEVDLMPHASGTLKNLVVDIGARVQRGQILAGIDAPQLVLEERQAEVAVKQVAGLIREAEARVFIAKAEVQVAQKAVLTKKAAVKSAEAISLISRRERERLDKARGRSIGSIASVSDGEIALAQAQEEKAFSEVLSAEAAMAGVRAEEEVKKGKVQLAEAALQALTANMEGAKLAQEKARLALDQTRVVAPMDGVVTRCDVRNGNYVRSDSTGSPSSLLTIQRTDQLRVVVHIPARQAVLTEPGAPAELSFDAFPGFHCSGKVTRTAFALDAKSHTMRVEIDLPNPNGRIRPGMTGSAEIRLAKSPHSLRVPRSAVFGPPAYAAAVYVFRDGKAHVTHVTLGAENAKEVEILSPLGPNDLVVTDPRNLTGDAVAVEVKQRTAPRD
jgi:RND family efflux transporter MFP subunit